MKEEKSQSEMWSDLVGKFFHRNDADGYVQQQGQIVGRIPEDALYLIQFCDWLAGSPNRITAVRAADFADGTWSFYEDAEAMRDAYQYGLGVTPRPSSRSTEKE